MRLIDGEGLSAKLSGMIESLNKSYGNAQVVMGLQIALGMVKNAPEVKQAQREEEEPWRE